jgi:hypothetical protein
MKPFLLFATVLLLCAAVFSFVPFMKKAPESFKPDTLGGVYADYIKGLPEMMGRRLEFTIPLATAGAISAFYPAALVLIIGRLRPAVGDSVRPLLVVGGLVALVGAVTNLVVMLVGQMSFGFGASSPKNPSIASWLIPLLQGVVAVVSVVTGLSNTCADLVQPWLAV